MEDTIQKVLNNYSSALRILRLYCADCHEPYLVRDSHFLYRNALAARDVCRLYFRYWSREFTPAQLKRFERILAFDLPGYYLRYREKYV